MESKASDLVFCKAEEKDFEPLLALMTKVLRDGDSLHADKFNLIKWKWKYFDMPDARPLIFLCKEAGSILGYYHCPVYRGTLKEKKSSFAMVQDVGVSEAARGKGVFRKLAEFATAELMKSGVNFIYTFPNGNSIHTFLKYNGYSRMETFSTFILPIKTEKIIASKIRFLYVNKIIGALADTLYSLRMPKINANYQLVLEEKVTDEMAQLFLQFNAQFSNSLTRDYTYLHWRFEQKPHGRIYRFSLKRDDKLEAIALISLEELLGCKAAVVLDFASTSPTSFSQLIAKIKAQAADYFETIPALFFTSVSNSNNSLFQESAFLKIPERLNPRALHLLGKNVTENELDVLDAKNWNFTLSDWDVL